jgi:transaldolase
MVDLKGFSERRVRIYADGADLASIERMAADYRVSGLTTNPTLVKKAGVKNYKDFCKAVLGIANNKPVSFEVFADDLKEMERQAREIASWGKVYVKVPVTNSLGEWALPVIRNLTKDGIRVNVTAVFTADQAHEVDQVTTEQDIVSIFAGRVADTGRDPELVMTWAADHLKAQVLWASAREVFNVRQADRCGCDIITLPPELIDKLDGFWRNLTDYSLETVKQFKQDAEGLTL